MYHFLSSLDSFVWGPPLLVFLVGTGFYLSVHLRLLQVFRLPKAIKLIFASDSDGQGDISSFAALATALAATVGTGNVVGVATAIKLGGPGALFWMWMAAFFGMATKYAEGVLAIKYRTKDAFIRYKTNDQVSAIQGREQALKRAITNVISNALKYGKTAAVDSESNERRLEITIDDDGPGIPADKREEVFKAFYRLEESRN